MIRRQNIESGLKRLHRKPGSYAGYELISEAATYAEQKKKKNKKMSENSKERLIIHNEIEKLIDAGWEKPEIISFLLNKYPSSQVRDFFNNYVDDHLKKRDYPYKTVQDNVVGERDE